MAKKILAVDDSTTMWQLVSHALRGAGYEVIGADDGVDGFDQATRENVQLILNDQIMPRLDGLAPVQKVRALPGYKTAPILVPTTEFGAGMKVKGRAAGATGWMMMAFDPRRLIDVVGKVFGLPRQSTVMWRRM